MDAKTMDIVLPNAMDFKQFWKEQGPFKYALTSNEFPPILLEPEQWLFSNDIIDLLKWLMQFDKRKMKLVKSEFNLENKKILRPKDIIPWKIHNFPEEWDGLFCETFTPRGYLTQKVIESSSTLKKEKVLSAFFKSLETNIGQLGYLLLKPRENSKFAAVQAYLKEWELDEKDAGLL
ncbi:MAG: hypothetical protein GY729_11285 [Desulfobacteraceae bacterium]|nr:hypothetical protein [Desulfobacteraceae bacterium]